MALEIERRFLVRDSAWRSQVAWEAEIKQGYLINREDGVTARIRLQRHSDGTCRAWLTIKAPADADAAADTRLEFEYPIPVEDAEQLLRLSLWSLEKKRHGLKLDQNDWILDVFSGKNSPLIIAEVELAHSDDRPPIPAWCGKEVTGMHQLSNAALARLPLNDWGPEDLLELFDSPK